MEFMGVSVAIWAIIGFNLCVSLVGVLIASRRLSESALAKSVSEVQIDLADLYELYERVLKSHQRLRSRVGMEKKRAAQAEEPPNGATTQTPEEWKREMRLKLHLGTLKP